MVLLGIPRKKSPVTPLGIDPRTVRLVAQRLIHYTTPGPNIYIYVFIYIAFKKSDLSSVRLLALLVRIPPGRVAVCLSSVLSDFAISHATAIIALTLVHGYYIDITNTESIITQICGAQDSVMLYVLFIYPGCGSYQTLVTKIQSSVTVHFPFRSVSC